MRTSLIVAGRLVFGLGVLGGIDSEAAGQCDYEVTQIIDGPVCGGGEPSFFGGAALTDSGEVAGLFTCFILFQGAIWNEVNGIAPLPFLSGFSQARVAELNSINEVVGTQFSSTLDWRAVIWQNGVPSRLPDWPGTTLSFAFAINRDGWITGYWGNGIFGPGEAAILWKPDGSMVNINDDLPGNTSKGLDINDLGQVTGHFGANLSSQAYLWDNGQVIELPIIPGGLTSNGLAINNQGHVVGVGSITPLGVTPIISHAFFWDGLTMIDIGTLPGDDRSSANDLNEVGQIVGTSFKTRSRAFLWRDGVMIDLNSLLPEPLDGAILGATAITRNGEILMSGGGVAVILSPIGSGPGDLDNNCIVNVSDLLLLLKQWGKAGSFADINDDGNVNVHDLLALLASWG